MDSFRRAIGVVNLRATRMIAFLIIVLSLVACTIVCVLAVWKVLVPDFAWRALASFGIVSLATAIFVSLNEGFGPALAPPRQTPGGAEAREPEYDP